MSESCEQIIKYDPAIESELCAPMLGVLPVDLLEDVKRIIILRGFGHSKGHIAELMGTPKRTYENKKGELITVRAKLYSRRKIQFVLIKYDKWVQHVRQGRQDIIPYVPYAAKG